MPRSSVVEKLDPMQVYIMLLLEAENLEPVKGKLWLQKEIFLIA